MSIFIIVTNHVSIPILSLPVMNAINNFTHHRITSLIITHMINISNLPNISVCVELVIVCVSINPMIADSVFMTIGCCVSCENVTSFEQTSKKCHC